MGTLVTRGHGSRSDHHFGLVRSSQGNFVDVVSYHNKVVSRCFTYKVGLDCTLSLKYIKFLDPTIESSPPHHERAPGDSGEEKLSSNRQKPWNRSKTQGRQ